MASPLDLIDWMQIKILNQLDHENCIRLVEVKEKVVYKGTLLPLPPSPSKAESIMCVVWCGAVRQANGVICARVHPLSVYRMARVERARIWRPIIARKSHVR